MTTDDFTTAARAEGQARITAMLEVSGASADIRAWFPAGFEKGAVWARDHLAQQEPTDAEVEAAAREIVKRVFLLSEERPWEDPGVVGEWKPVARAVLTAAKEARS
ncbi:hypothetical protein [Brevibacterium sandarakinum]|uniref:hypothetical protein n=1 Tax=Brevibacterium sandarakinum TaxID=629680 RepID=UPI00264F7EDC|nr:hypothetical protein [Brevibacterium sandarakinum]MDN5659016.1 hypothetical protein [Brevibacterium sandarakinum]